MASNLRESLLLGMGNPLLDIIATTDDQFLEQYGLKPNDAILAEDKHKPMYNEMVEKYKAEYIAGGSTQNSMRVVQWIVKKPKVSGFMGCIAKDHFGNILEENARKEGLNCHYQYSDTEPTGTCAVAVTKNGTNRSLCANLAAANCFTKDHLDKPENRALVEEANFYYISGFFLTVSPDSIMEVAKHACAHNKVFAMNFSAPFLSQFFKEPMMAAFPYVDIMFGNDTEATTFANEQELGTEDIKEIALRVCSLPKENNKRKRTIVVTQGSRPVIVAHDGKIEEFPVEQLDDNKIVDTNGAGDAFVGGFLAQLIQGKSLDICVKCGIWAAAQVIQQSGCSLPENDNFQE